MKSILGLNMKDRISIKEISKKLPNLRNWLQIIRNLKWVVGGPRSSNTIWQMGIYNNILDP